MTNDKDSEVLVEDFEIIVGSKHHETKVSQSELLRLINGGAKIHHIKALRQLTQSDEEGPCLKCNAAGDDCGEHAPSWEELSVYWKAEAERLRQPAQSDALLIANERKAIAAWLRGEVDTDYTDPEYDIGRNLADAVERGAYIQEQSK
jgi:hypothetical protein